MKKTMLLAVVLVFLGVACNKKDSSRQGEVGTVVNDTTTGMVVADTIIYDVVILNPNPDDAWASKCLEGLDHKLLIDNIFAMIYSEKSVAYNHETGEKLTPKQVEKIESEEIFDRTNIGKIQFTEVWYMNPGKTEMTKKVLSMVLGYNYYTSNGELIGHKALFRVEI